jgi:lysophospholipase L1-like esterase
MSRIKIIFTACLAAAFWPVFGQDIVLDDTIAAQLNAQSPTMNTDVPRVRWVVGSYDEDRYVIDSSEISDDYLSSIFNFSRWATAETDDVSCWGDSLTLSGSVAEDRYPSVLAELIGGGTWCVNLGVGGETSAQIYSRIESDTRHMAAIQVFWLGRNDASTGWDATASAALKTRIADSISLITSTPKRYLVLGVINGDYADEYDGTTKHTNLLSLNDDLAALYPSNFIDIRQVLIDEADPVADATDISNDVPPDSLRSDDIHLNAAGYAIVAQAVYDFLDTKGWLPE